MWFISFLKEIKEEKNFLWKIINILLLIAMPVFFGAIIFTGFVLVKGIYDAGDLGIFLVGGTIGILTGIWIDQKIGSG